MEIKEIKELAVIRSGLTLDFTYWYDLNLREYNDGGFNDYLDGKQWNGSVNELLNNDSFHEIQKVAPQITCDIKAITGFNNFDYVIIPISNNGSYFYYGVYALTNNKTILQFVGQLEFYVPNILDNYSNTYRRTGVRSVLFIPGQDPNENYVPITREFVENIVVNGVTYTYSGHGDHFEQLWTNDQTDVIFNTSGWRNPEASYGAYDQTGNYYQIESVNYYSGVTPPGVTPIS